MIEIGLDCVENTTDAKIKTISESIKELREDSRPMLNQLREQAVALNTEFLDKIQEQLEPLEKMLNNVAILQSPQTIRWFEQMAKTLNRVTGSELLFRLDRIATMVFKIDSLRGISNDINKLDKLQSATRLAIAESSGVMAEMRSIRDSLIDELNKLDGLGRPTAKKRPKKKDIEFEDDPAPKIKEKGEIDIWNSAEKPIDPRLSSINWLKSTAAKPDDTAIPEPPPEKKPDEDGTWDMETLRI